MIFITRLDLAAITVFNYRLDEFQLHVVQTPGCGNNNLRKVLFIAEIFRNFSNEISTQLAIQALQG